MWQGDLRVGMLWAWTSGEMFCHLVMAGQLPIHRTPVQRAMQWPVAKDGRTRNMMRT
jgi:hypothetical protein